MRNILVFPDGTQQDFQYPSNREISVGEKLQVALENGTHFVEVEHIEKSDKAIFYHLKFSS